MSWDATLVDDRGHCRGDWNYTHNCNGMANTVLFKDYEHVSVAQEVLGIGGPRPSSTWWKELDGLDGSAGAALLDRIITGLTAEPERFRAMNPTNPTNGWGDYDEFIAILREMRDAVPEWPTKWEVSG